MKSRFASLTLLVVSMLLAAVAAWNFPSVAQTTSRIAPGAIALDSAKFIVGNGSNVGAGVSLSGDATIDNTGALTVANGVVTTGKLSELTIQYATVTLTNTDMLALRATPITVVAAPGASKRIQFLGATINTNATAGAYTETDDNFVFRFTDGAGIIQSTTGQTTGFIDQAGKMHLSVLPVTDALCTDAQATNQALVVHNSGDGEFGGGNAANTVKITAAYRVVGTL